MIRDQRLRLASNLSIGTASRQWTGIQNSDILPGPNLREFGRGEQLFCCVTVTQTFSDHGSVNLAAPLDGLAGTGLVQFSIKQESSYTLAGINALITGLDGSAYALHKKNPTLGTSGWILGNVNYSNSGFNVTNRNFVVGKKFCFPISPVTHNSKLERSYSGVLAPDLTNNFLGDYTTLGGVYLLCEEVNCSDQTFAATNITTTGNIDVDIVMVAEAGAGPTFNDVRHYPTRTIVK